MVSFTFCISGDLLPSVSQLRICLFFQLYYKWLLLEYCKGINWDTAGESFVSSPLHVVSCMGKLQYRLKCLEYFWAEFYLRKNILGVGQQECKTTLLHDFREYQSKKAFRGMGMWNYWEGVLNWGALSYMQQMWLRRHISTKEVFVRKLYCIFHSFPSFYFCF